MQHSFCLFIRKRHNVGFVAPECSSICPFISIDTFVISGLESVISHQFLVTSRPSALCADKRVPTPRAIGVK
jgi:hypothetical protein